MAEQDSVPSAEPDGLQPIFERMRALEMLFGGTEMLTRAREMELESRVQNAADLYTRGMDAAAQGREAEARQLFTQAGQWAGHILTAAETYDKDRFAALGVEGALIAGHSLLRRGEFFFAARELYEARGVMVDSLPAHDDLFLKVAGVDADLREVKTALLAQAQATGVDLVESIRFLQAVAKIEAELPGVDPERLRNTRMLLLSRQIEALETGANPDVSVEDQRFEALRTTLLLISEQPLDVVGPVLRPAAYTYARLLRQEMDADNQFNLADLSRVTADLKVVVAYLESGDRGGVPDTDTREALRVLREFSRAHANALRPEGPGWDEKSDDDRRAAVDERLELLEQSLSSGAKASPDDAKQRAADTFDLFSALVEAGPAHWPACPERFGSLPTQLAESFGAKDERVGRAAESLAAIEFYQGRTDLAAGRARAALPTIKRAIRYQELALGNLRARGADTAETRETLTIMRRTQGQVATGKADGRSVPTLTDALRAKQRAAGMRPGRGIATAVASPGGPALKSELAAREARSAIRRALRRR